MIASGTHFFCPLILQNDESMAAKIMGMVGISTGSSGLYDDAGGDDSGVKCCGVNPNRLVTKYLHWTFRSSIFLVLFSAALGFFSLTLFFALLIFWAGNNHPLCIHVNGYEFGADGARFSDAYALSWVTFSTVVRTTNAIRPAQLPFLSHCSPTLSIMQGYGLIFPSTSAVTKGTHDCAGITTLCTLESFVGILFASFCGAIVFGKVARIRSHAQVTFSDPIVVRFGAGVDPHVLDDDSSSDEKDDDKLEKIRFLPFPVLEFRVINRLSAVKGGELMDATMNVVASIDECQANSSVRNAARGRRRKGKRRGVRPGARPAGRRQSLIQRAIVSSHAHPGIPEEKPFLSTRTISDSALTAPKTAGKVHQTFEEDPSGKLVPKRIFSKLELDTPDHPFFKRVWTVRHELDVHSPLLTNNARRMIRENNGHWPEELNNHAAVRASVQFDQILVSLSGTSNADANSVYAQKVYEYIDMNVGYRFANVLYRDPRDQSLFVDPTVLNDVLEQHGGGAEPLTVMHLPNLSGIFVT